MPGALIQTLDIADLAAAVVAAAKGQIAAGTEEDLTEAEARALPELTMEMRRWMGFPERLFRPRIPAWLLGLTAKGADILGHLGWRSPLRNTAVQVLTEGIRGDPSAWAKAGGAPAVLCAKHSRPCAPPEPAASPPAPFSPCRWQPACCPDSGSPRD